MCSRPEAAEGVALYTLLDMASVGGSTPDGARAEPGEGDETVEAHRPGTCSLCDNPPAAMFEFRLRERSVIVWICDIPHRTSAFSEAFGLRADEAQGIALEIAAHLHIWAAAEESGLTDTSESPAA